MTKKELMEQLASVPDDAVILAPNGSSYKRAEVDLLTVRAHPENNFYVVDSGDQCNPPGIITRTPALLFS